MADIDVPYLAHTEDMSQPKPPTYDPSADQIHNHYYQVSNDEPSRQPWYRRRSCVLLILLVVTILIILAVVVTVAVVVVLRNNHHGDLDKPPMDSGNTISSTEVSTSSSETTSLDLPSTTLWQSIVTVTMPAPESSAAETKTAVLTITASEEEDLGDMLSSILADFPFFTTEVVTVSVTEQPSTTSSTTSYTTTSTTSTTTLTTTSSETSSESSVTSTSSAPPSLSTDSNLAAVDVNTGPSRRLVIWQDHDDNLIAFDSGTNTPDQIYNIADALDDQLRAKHTTPLTAATDDEGAVHLFYVDNEDGMIGHLVQREAGSWTAQSKTMHPLSSSSLSATWHKGSNSTSGEISLAFQGTKGEILLYLGADKAASEKAFVVNVSSLLHLEIGDRDLVGLAIASGKMLSDAGSEGDLYLLIEGKDEVLVAECSISFGQEGELESECWWSEAFTGESVSVC